MRHSSGNLELKLQLGVILAAILSIQFSHPWHLDRTKEVERDSIFSYY